MSIRVWRIHSILKYVFSASLTVKESLGVKPKESQIFVHDVLGPRFDAYMSDLSLFSCVEIEVLVHMLYNKLCLSLPVTSGDQ